MTFTLFLHSTSLTSLSFDDVALFPVSRTLYSALSQPILSKSLGWPVKAFTYDHASTLGMVYKPP